MIIIAKGVKKYFFINFTIDIYTESINVVD
jgi:hypothetical protein